MSCTVRGYAIAIKRNINTRAVISLYNDMIWILDPLSINAVKHCVNLKSVNDEFSARIPAEESKLQKSVFTAYTTAQYFVGVESSKF
jgi:hypothetical protein